MSIESIVASSRSYFIKGETLNVAFRKDALRKLRSVILARENEINAALRKDLNKSASESYMCEVGMTLAELSYDMTGLYQANEDGWTYTYPLAPGMYTLVETGDSGATVDGKAFVTGSTVYSVNGQPIQKGEPFEIAAGRDCIVVIRNQYKQNSRITVSNVVDDDVSGDETFEYTLTATDENGNPCEIRDDKTHDGSVSFTLKAGESKSFSVPNGCSYIVKQEKKAGFEVDQLEYSGTATNDASFTFINTRVEQPPQEDDGDETDDLPPQEDDEDGTDDLPPQDGADDLPETGDPSSLLGWAALLSASIAGLKRRKTR